MKKKSEIKSNKWKVIIISTFTLPVLLLLLFLFLDTSTKKSSETESAVNDINLNISLEETEDVVAAGDEKELNLLDYDDVKDYSYKAEDKQDDNLLIYKPSHSTENDLTSEDNEKTDSEKSEDSQPKTSDDKKANDSQNKTSSDTNSKKIVIDESSDTMKDETKQNEYKGEDSPEEIEFFDVSPEKGSDIKGDVPASGVHLGNWN